MSSSPVMLITGASSGIGEATARVFGRQGYRLALAARRLPRLEALAGEIQAQGGQALPVAADVANFQEIERLVGAVLDHFGQIDLLFNNAGFGRLDWLDNLHPLDDIEAQLRVNLLGTIWTTRLVLPHMIARRKGHIINMSSMAGLIATPTYTIYAASKFAVRGFTEALRREVSIYGIRVSGIYPGGVSTEFSQHTGVHQKSGLTTPSALRLSAEDVAQAVLSLARRPRRSLILPAPMKVAVWLNALFPALVDWMIERRFTRVERGL